MLAVVSGLSLLDCRLRAVSLFPVVRRAKHETRKWPRAETTRSLVGLQYFCRYKTFFSLQVVVLTFSVHFANFGCMIRLASAGLNTLEF